MSTGPDAHTTSQQASRFRTARATTPSSPEEHLEQLLDDGERLLELLGDFTREAATAGDPAQIVRLGRVAALASDPHRAYAGVKHAAQVLVAGSRTVADTGDLAWATWFDHLVDLVVPVLERDPHQPELVTLLGLATYELGHVAAARRLFEAVRDIDPSHQQARANLRACKERMQRGAASSSVPDRLAPAYARLRGRVKELPPRVGRLTDRTISLCMIVKDEEELLPGCLAAVAAHVDQLVVVDTGSTDRTREIALEHGAQLVDFAWTGSFSDARNEALRHATGDWVLYLDADEHLVDGGGQQLRELARRTWVEGFHLVETHFTGDIELGGEATHTPMRLFRNREGYAWRGRVHEQVMWAMPTWLPERFQHTTVRVDHYGYLAHVIDERDKNERNLVLLMQQVAEERSAFTLFNIGTEHASMHDWSTARTWLEEALEVARTEHRWQDQQFAPLLVQRLVTSRRATGSGEAAIELAREALGWWPSFTDLVYECALVHLGRGDWQVAADTAREALELGDAPARFVATTGKGTFQARTLLASALRHLGDGAGARDEFARSLREAPHYLPPVVDLTELLVEQLGADAASVELDQLLGDRAARGATVNMLVGAVLHEAAAFAGADARYERVLAATPGHGGALVARAELRLAQGRIREAYDLALSVDRLDRLAPHGARTAFLAAVVLGSSDAGVRTPADDVAKLLVEPARRIAEGEELSTGERAVYVAWRERIAPSSDPLHVLVPADAGAAAAVFANLEALAKLEASDAFEVLHPLAAQVLPDEKERRLRFAQLYLRRRFADMAGEELITCAERFGPDAEILTGLGKVATIKELWEDAEVFLAESLQLDPAQPETARLLAAVRDRAAG